MYVCRTLSYKGVEFEVVEVPLEPKMMVRMQFSGHTDIKDVGHEVKIMFRFTAIKILMKMAIIEMACNCFHKIFFLSSGFSAFVLMSIFSVYHVDYAVDLRFIGQLPSQLDVSYFLLWILFYGIQPYVPI